MTDATIEHIIKDIIKDHFIDSQDLYNILISLGVSNFLIFSGPSGSGKTSLVDKLAHNLGGKPFKLPVKSSFTDESALLGYWNPLLSRYEGTETLRFILQAEQDQTNPYFLLLDEMNLSKIENYFSTFLSEIDKIHLGETGKITLFETNITTQRQYENIVYFFENYLGGLSSEVFSKYVEGLKYEDFVNMQGSFDEKGHYKEKDKRNSDSKSLKVQIQIPKNLKIIGTINEDESTNAISNKVFDRAQLITFGVDLFGDFGKIAVPKPLIDRKLPSLRGETRLKHTDLAKTFSSTKDYETIKTILKSLNEQIQKISLNESIGYRALEEMMNYIKDYSNYTQGDSTITDWQEALDYQIAQKVLPKLKIYSLVTETQKQAFQEIGRLLSEYSEDEKYFSKSRMFYQHLVDNLL